MYICHEKITVRPSKKRKCKTHPLAERTRLAELCEHDSSRATWLSCSLWRNISFVRAQRHLIGNNVPQTNNCEISRGLYWPETLQHSSEECSQSSEVRQRMPLKQMLSMNWGINIAIAPISCLVVPTVAIKSHSPILVRAELVCMFLRWRTLGFCIINSNFGHPRLLEEKSIHILHAFEFVWIITSVTGDFSPSSETRFYA